jgi:hypothetical protein
MRPVASLGLAALVLVASASGAAHSNGTDGNVISIAADGRWVAIHARNYSTLQCDAGVVEMPGKAIRLLGPTCGSKTSSDIQYDGIALAGTRVAWADYNTGNHVYCNGPYTATLANPKPKSLDGCPEEPDNEDLVWEFKGDGGLLVARSFTRCEASCEPDHDRTFDKGVAIWSVGAGGLKKLLAAKDDTKLLDADVGRILLRDPAGKLLVLSAAGKQVASLAVDAKSAFMDGKGRVSVPSGSTLRTYDVAKGSIVETCTMKPGAKVWDVEDGLAVYSVGSELHLLTIANNRDRVVSTAKTLAGADLEPNGLYWAYNVPGAGTKPGRVSFLPASQLPK